MNIPERKYPHQKSRTKVDIILKTKNIFWEDGRKTWFTGSKNQADIKEI
jgi:hypothetical protein